MEDDIKKGAIDVHKYNQISNILNNMSRDIQQVNNIVKEVISSMLKIIQ